MHCWKVHEICYETYSKFCTLSSSAKKLKISQDWTKLQSLKVGNFLRHGVEWPQCSRATKLDVRILQEPAPNQVTIMSRWCPLSDLLLQVQHISALPFAVMLHTKRQKFMWLVEMMSHPTPQNQLSHTDHALKSVKCYWQIAPWLEYSTNYRVLKVFLNDFCVMNTLDKYQSGSLRQVAYTGYSHSLDELQFWGWRTMK